MAQHQPAWGQPPPERWEAPVARLEERADAHDETLKDIKESTNDLMKWIRGTLLAVVMVGVVTVLNLVLHK